MKGSNKMGILGVFVIFLNISLGIAAILGAITGYFGVTYADDIDIPGGMDNEGMISIIMTVIGYFALATCGIALIGFFVLNFGHKLHKVFYAFPLGFAGLILLIMGIYLPIAEHVAGNELREMYEKCCAKNLACCIGDEPSKEAMDKLHRRYNCCAFDGPGYFKELDDRTTPLPEDIDRERNKPRDLPLSCCPESANDDAFSFRCSAENAYKAACKTKIYAELNPYVITLEAYCFTTSFFCGVVTALIVVMASMNIYMNKN